MSIIDLRFSTKSLQQLPHPTTGCREYRDIHCPQLRALVYPNQITLAFRATINNQRIYETLGTFPHLDIEDARLNTMIRLGNKKRTAIQSRRHTVEQAINELWIPDMQLYKKSPQSELSKLNRHIRPFWGSVASVISPGNRKIRRWPTTEIKPGNNKPPSGSALKDMLSGCTR